jgi:hypothetical protein
VSSATGPTSPPNTSARGNRCRAGLPTTFSDSELRPQYDRRLVGAASHAGRVGRPDVRQREAAPTLANRHGRSAMHHASPELIEPTHVRVFSRRGAGVSIPSLPTLDAPYHIEAPPRCVRRLGVRPVARLADALPSRRLRAVNRKRIGWQ